jgi:prepilin-type N-terminal cleavage/methylation domain-containing protein
VLLSKHSDWRGFTLTELSVALGILAILITLVITNYERVLGRSEKIRCISNLRGLYGCFASYVSDQGIWPQIPEDIDEEDAYADWWLREMKPYGATQALWTCPTIRRAQASLPENYRNKIHYTPTQFDAHPGRAYQWPTQPWLIEIANAHGHGALIIFTNGSVRELNDLL